MVDFFELILTILPFIVGLIAVGLIPSKRKNSNDQNQPEDSENKKTPSVEKQVVIYMIGFFILVLGTYYFISSMFGEDVENQRMIYIINGLFLGIVGIGIIGVNYRNFSELTSSKLKATSDYRVEGPVDVSDTMEVAEVEAVEVESETISSVSPEEVRSELRRREKRSRDKEKDKAQLVECPKCGNVIKVLSTKRPIKISCPKCGIEGMIQ